MTYQYLQHKDCGEVFIAQLNHSGEITGAAGPYSPEAAMTKVLSLLIYWRHFGRFIRENREDFREFVQPRQDVAVQPAI